MPMRLTFLVSQLDNGGGCRVIAHYAQGLIRLGHTVLVVAPAPNLYGRVNNFLRAIIPNMRRQLPNHFARLGVPVTTLERYRPIAASDVPDADVIIATWWETAIWLKNFPASKGKKIHFIQDYEIWNGHIPDVHAALALPLLKITISHWIAEVIVRLRQPTPIIIPNGVDHELFWSPARKRPLQPTVGFVYSDNLRKGGDIAIDAIRKVQIKHPDLRVVVFGHAPPSLPIDVANMVYFASPAQNKLREIYGECTAWIFPSREEGFGLPILEALACGTPVIACPSGAAPEILTAGGGTLLRTFNSDEMADEILRYLEKSENEWREVSADANEISKEFQWSKSIYKLESEFLEMVRSELP